MNRDWKPVQGVRCGREEMRHARISERRIARGPVSTGFVLAVVVNPDFAGSGPGKDRLQRSTFVVFVVHGEPQQSSVDPSGFDEWPARGRVNGKEISATARNIEHCIRSGDARRSAARSHGCLTVLGVSARDHIVGFSRIQIRPDSEFQPGEQCMSVGRKVLAQPGACFG